MKEFDIEFKFTGRSSVTVKAETEDEAIEKFDKLNEDYLLTRLGNRPTWDVDFYVMGTKEAKPKEKPLPKIFKWVKGSYQPTPEYPRYVVDCKLYDANTTRDVFWSARKNSYVLAEVSEQAMRTTSQEFLDRFYWKRGDQYFMLVSINGAGEPRWDLSKDRLGWHGYGDEEIAAATHFGLMEGYNICHECKRLVEEDDTVWIDPETTKATTGPTGKPYHTQCAPAQEKE